MAVKTGKKAPIRRRRERKNIEKGSAHIQSTFNTLSLLYPTHRATRSPGRPRANSVSAAPESPLPSLRRALLRQLPRLRWSMA